MTADMPAQQTADAANVVPAHAEQEHQRARRVEAWSIVWVLLALAIWGWFAFLMLADYGPEFGGRALCRGPLVGPSSDDSLCRDPLRQWPALLGILALAVIVTVSAAATIVYAKVLSRLARRDGPSVQPQD
ncbi:hypothetical protein OG818_15405 [Streptomyces virginiae]|uniref:hypothetical protein n=1 Tax=Streptomyces TaxID=1883 RepID=UPI00207941E2|nr:MULTISPECIES: hypothetical protein [Streptomyces]MCM9083079.1 hypothetical protein [Streptomyces spororaveus]MCX4717186.1 hypothetical protein [Streptomyces virginiae]